MLKSAARSRALGQITQKGKTFARDHPTLPRMSLLPVEIDEIAACLRCEFLSTIVEHNALQISMQLHLAYCNDIGARVTIQPTTAARMLASLSAPPLDEDSMSLANAVPSNASREVPLIKQFGPVIRVTVVLTEASFASTSIAPIEIFHSAGRLWNLFHGESARPRFEVRVASVDGNSVVTLCDVGIVPTCAIEEIVDTDIIILPASGLDVQDRIAKTTPLLPWLRKWHKKGAYIAGICTGVAILAESGLLDGRQATTHWAVADILKEKYPAVLWRADQFITEDGPLYCSGGVYASIDLSLFLVEKLCGHEIALKCAKSLLLSMPRSSQAGYAVLPLSLPHSDAKIRDTEEYLQAHSARDISIDFMAERIGMGPRSFIRRFKSATGHAPGAYVQSLRMSAAKELLESGSIPVVSVSSKVGYSDLAFFRRLFKRHTGLTPTEYRERFGKMSFERGSLMGG